MNLEAKRPSRLHKLKCQAPHFSAVLSGLKRAEVRLNDRDYQEGDYLLLAEALPREDGSTEPTGREFLAVITHLLRGGQHGLDSQYVMLSLQPIADVPR